ncbi:SART-1 protein [Powellomyces hirtus]|nr:SART-1 protein [Powellomyces hirtus]
MAHDDQDLDGQAEVSMTIEQTNALRISLGMKPLTEGKSTEKQQEAEENFAKHKDELAKKAARKDLIDTLAKEKAKAQRNVVLEGPTLGAASDEEDETGDSLAWVKRQREKDEKRKLKVKKKAALLARKKELELTEMDQAATSAYKASDLKGLRVDHDLEDVMAGGESILTLKDSTIAELEEEGDVLQSVQLADSERNRKNMDNKKKKGAYNVYDDDEFGNVGTKRNILSQYDEEIDGPQKSGFVINEEGAVDLEQQRKDVSEQMRANAIALTYDKAQEIKDYYTQEEMVAFKKPKKKRKPRRDREGVIEGAADEQQSGSAGRDHGSRRRRAVLDEDEDAMDVDSPADQVNESSVQSKTINYSMSNRNTNTDNVNFVDDDDLQSALARTRRLQLQKRSKTDVEDMAKAALQIRDDDTLPEGAVVLSATSEFVRNLATAPTPKALEPPRPNRPALPKDESAPPKVDAMDVDEAPTEERGGWDMDEAVDEEPHEKSTMKAEGDDKSDDGEFMPAPIEEEPLIGAGLASTLALLTQKGFVEKASPEEVERLRKQNEKRTWLAEQKKLEKIREMQRLKEKELKREKNKQQQGKGQQQQHRDEHDWYREEQEARYAERERARETEERFKKYIPDVNLEYHDEYGRKLNQKEAFRQLSHKFHGKTSGKMKTERRLRKIEDELKMEKMSSNDTPLGTAGALVERTRAAGAAHVVLSVGNRSALPTDVSFASIKPNKPITKPTPRPHVTTTTVIDTDRNVNTFNREKVTFGLGGSVAAAAAPIANKPVASQSPSSRPSSPQSSSAFQPVTATTFPAKRKTDMEDGRETKKSRT